MDNSRQVVCLVKRGIDNVLSVSVRVAWLAPILIVVGVAACTGSSTASIVTPTSIEVDAPSPSSPITHTAPPSLYANTLEDAIRLTKQYYSPSGNSLHSARVDSVSYVETTGSQAKAVFDPYDWD